MTNGFLGPSNSKTYGKEPRYHETNKFCQSLCPLLQYFTRQAQINLVSRLSLSFASIDRDWDRGWAQIIWMGPLQDPVTWYGINYTGTQMTQWDFQNKGKSGWTGKSFFVLEVPLRHLRLSVIYSVPCDWILQRAY